MHLAAVHMLDGPRLLPRGCYVGSSQSETHQKRFSSDALPWDAAIDGPRPGSNRPGVTNDRFGVKTELSVVIDARNRSLVHSGPSLGAPFARLGRAPPGGRQGRAYPRPLGAPRH